MNDIYRGTDLQLDPVQLRAPWWVQTGRAVRRSPLAAMILVLLGLAALGALGWYLAHRNATARPVGFAARARTASTVGFSVASRQDVPIYLDALGTVTPLATAVVQAQVSGVMTRVYYREGQLVKAGDPLVQIDPRPFELALEQARGNLARDQANLSNQRVIVDRDRTLLKQDSIAQQQVDTDTATQKQLEAAVLTDQAALNSANLNLQWSKVTAPISGRVGIRPVDVGNYITPSLTNGIATITQLTPIDVLFTLPADVVPHLQERLRAGADLPTTVLDRTRTSVLGQGKFLTLDNQVDTSTGTVRTKARFANDNGALFPQQFVNVRLLLDTVRNALVVPAAAVRHGPNGDYVYVIAPDNTAHIQIVTTGPSVDDKISITAGLNGGERVVTEGGDRLVDGAVVRLPGQAGGRERRGAGWGGAAGTGRAAGAQSSTANSAAQQGWRHRHGRSGSSGAGNPDSGGAGPGGA
ncbi:MAG TPA: efflux RND transporter periplasmic adaptor subunit [Steroidobacteraceae bacterium]|nr:efflux RND transporter periplasmic adaptor subunit [Steroidobacteraceae bacterium]